MKPSKSFIWLFTVAALTAATFYILLHDTPPGQITGALEKASPLFILLGFGAMFLYILGEGWSIRISMRSMGEQVPFWDCVRYAFIGHYFSAITPSASGGQPAQVFWMAKEGNHPSKGALTLLLISAVFQIAMLFYGLFMFVALKRLLIAPAASIKWLILFGGIVNLVLIGAILTMIFSQRLARKMAFGGLALLCRLRLVKDRTGAEQKVEKQLQDYQAGAGHLKQNPRLLLALFVISIVRLTILYSIPYLVYCGFGLSGHSFLEVLGLQALFMIAVSSIPLPGSVGASEGTFLLLYSVLFTRRFLQPAMLLSRGISFYALLLVSGLVVAFSRGGKRAAVG